MLMSTYPDWQYTDTNRSTAPGVGFYGDGTTITSGAANTKGDWTQIHAGFTFDTEFVILRIGATRTSTDAISGILVSSLFDIGIGPDSANVTIICDDMGAGNADPATIYFLPLRIPASQKVWARHQNNNDSAKGGVVITAYGGNRNPGTFPTCSKVVSMGADEVNSLGTAITFGASGAVGAWTAISSSTPQAFMGLISSALLANDSTLVSGAWRIQDIGVGGSGSEVLVLGNAVNEICYGAAEQRYSVCMPAFINLPAGSRVVARGSCDQANDSNLTLIVYGLVR